MLRPAPDVVAAAPHDRAEQLAGIGRWSIDLASGALTTNAAARVMLGWPAEQGEPGLVDFLTAIHPADRDLVRACAERLIRTGEEYTIEHRVQLAGGRPSHMRAVASAGLDADGRVLAIHGITMDVTDLRRAVEDAELARDRSRAVLASLHEGYFVAEDDVIVEVNDALTRLTGFAAHELVGTGPSYPFWPPEQQAELAELRGCLAAGAGGTRELETVCRDGSRRWVAMTATGLPGPADGRLWLVLLRDVTAERARGQELEARAATDVLTGLPNSRAFREALRDAVTAAEGASLSLALIDVDHFKAVNDSFGHAVGDETLVAFVQRLRAATAGSGELARVGGEEFALLLPGHDSEAAHAVLRTALQAVRASPLPTVGTITASAGVAQLLDGMSDDGLYRLADELLYEAKRRGRDQVR